jgi:hypothetical protein
MPRTRKLLAVPFVGKDVPSRESEFSHPDVVIGLTILAFRYEVCLTPRGLMLFVITVLRSAGMRGSACRILLPS